MIRRKLLMGTAPLLLGFALVATPALAANPRDAGHTNVQAQAAKTGQATTDTAAMESNAQQPKAGVQKMVKNAIAEAKTMEKDPQLKNLMAKAKGPS